MHIEEDFNMPSMNEENKMNGTPGSGGRTPRRRATSGSEGSRIPLATPTLTPTLPRRQLQLSPGGLMNRHRSLQSLNGGSPNFLRPCDREDDSDSVRSFASGISQAGSCASQCEHKHFALNGTTYSIRSKRYIVHCSPTHSSPEEYLTPTQRANLTIRKLRVLLTESQAELLEKEHEINRLTKEIVELRLRAVDADETDEAVSPEALSNGHASLVVTLASPESNGLSPSPNPPTLSSTTSSLSDSQQNTQILQPSPSTQPLPNFAICSTPGGGVSPGSSEAPAIPSEPPLSLVDSGHFEDLHSSPQSSPRTSILEKELDRLKQQHSQELRTLRESTATKVESLLQRLAEANERYNDLKPQFEAAQQRLEKLEQEKELLQAKYEETEQKHKTMYLQMFNKGQQSIAYEGDASTSTGEPSTGPVPPPTCDVVALVRQLEVTRQELESVKDKDFWSAANLLSGKEAVSIWNMCRKVMYKKLLESKKKKPEQDADITLKFLKSAIYYFLTDRENASGHLAAIQSILGFTSDEKAAIEKSSNVWKY